MLKISAALAAPLAIVLGGAVGPAVAHEGLAKAAPGASAETSQSRRLIRETREGETCYAVDRCVGVVRRDWNIGGSEISELLVVNRSAFAMCHQISWTGSQLWHVWSDNTWLRLEPGASGLVAQGMEVDAWSLNLNLVPARSDGQNCPDTRAPSTTVES